MTLNNVIYIFENENYVCLLTHFLDSVLWKIETLMFELCIL